MKPPRLHYTFALARISLKLEPKLSAFHWDVTCNPELHRMSKLMPQQRHMICHEELRREST